MSLTTPTPAPADTAPATPGVTPSPWGALRQLTAARIAQGRAGVSLPTQAHLAFQLAHAQARDAVHLGLDAQAMTAALATLGGPVLALDSAAPDRATYLQRPDLGRRLSAASRQALIEHSGPELDTAEDDPAARSHDLAVVVADGLSALATGRHALPLLQALLPGLRAAGWRLAPIALVRQARVAVADEVGQLLRARLVLILIGERPGLSSPDSLGAYLTWMPRVGRTDAERNCVSNIRPEGLAGPDAAAKLRYLLDEAASRQLSGVALKDETPVPGGLAAAGGSAAFLLPGR